MADDFTAMSHESRGVCFCGVDHEIYARRYIHFSEEDSDAGRI